MVSKLLASLPMIGRNNFYLFARRYIPTTTPAPSPCPPHQHRVGNICEWERCPQGFTSKLGKILVNSFENLDDSRAHKFLFFNILNSIRHLFPRILARLCSTCYMSYERYFFFAIWKAVSRPLVIYQIHK